jgi:hypothetical protein
MESASRARSAAKSGRVMSGVASGGGVLARFREV